MIVIICLIILALSWMIFASVQDLKKREISDWLNFSLILFALGVRIFYCLFSSDNFLFFYQGLIGLGFFFILGNLLYYGRIFAGGDAKLMIALGAILPLSENFLVNIWIFVVFLFLFFFIGGIYGLIWSAVLMFRSFKNFKKEFCVLAKKRRYAIYFIMFSALMLMIFGFIENLLFYFGILIFILPYFYLFAKSVDKVCMIKEIKTKELKEGDWLYKDVRVGRKIIGANWNGLNKKEIIELTKRYRKVEIRQGIPFVPVFLISFLVLLCVLRMGLWNSFW